jgi:hypothetical protein
MTEPNNDEIVALGVLSEALLRDDTFNRLVELFNQQCFSNFANTTVNQRNIREEAFARYDGVRTFIGMMAAYAAEMHELTDTKEDTAPSDEPDAP